MNKFMKKAHKGFTIIQLVIGMLIFAILTGIAFYGVSVYTAQANETRVDSDLSTFEVAIKDYMLNNAKACSDGTLSLANLDHYLTDENKTKSTDIIHALGTNETAAKFGASAIGVSTLTDPWGHEYRIVIANDVDADKTDHADKAADGAKGTDRAMIYVYTCGKDSKGAGDDTKHDDSVLCVQYSDGEVYSRVYQPSDVKNGSIQAPAYAAFGDKTNNADHYGQMAKEIFAISK